MRVDLPDARCVILDVVPDSITDFAQQSGRAGRDGQPARCIALLSPGDMLRLSRKFRSVCIATRFRPWRRMSLHREWLPGQRLMRLLLTERCIPAGIAASFGHRVRPCGRCSACLRGPLTMRAPDCLRTSEEKLRLWLILWQRDALARAAGVTAEQLFSRQEARRMARTLELPMGFSEPVREAMQRLLTALKAEIKHAEEPETDR